MGEKPHPGSLRATASHPRPRSHEFILLTPDTGLVHFNCTQYDRARFVPDRVILQQSSLVKAHYYLSLTCPRPGDRVKKLLRMHTNLHE